MLRPLRPALALVLAALPACGSDGASSTATTTTSASTASSSGGAGGSGGGAGGGGSAPCALGSSWKVLDDYLRSPGEPSNPAAIAVAPNGEVYAAGIAKKGTFGWVVRKSADAGATWTTVVEEMGGANDLAVDGSGAVYAIGGAAAGRVVQKSVDGGSTWQPVDAVALSPTAPCDTGHIAAGAGVVVSAGSCDDTGWIVRRSADGGATWTTVLTYELEAGHRARIGDVAVDAQGRIVVAGSPQDALDVPHWIVRRSDAQGGAWTTVDDFQLPGGAYAVPRSITIAPGGVFVVGTAAETAATEHWIVRRADLDATTFTTLDDHTGPGQGAGAVGLHETALGELVVVGVEKDGAGIASAITRRSADAGATWTVMDTYAYVAGQPTAPSPLAVSPTGELYGLVRGVDAGGAAHWLARKLACE